MCTVNNVESAIFEIFLSSSIPQCGNCCGRTVEMMWMKMFLISKNI